MISLESSQCWRSSLLSACHQRRGGLDFWSPSWSYSRLTPATSHPSYLGCLGAGYSTPGEVSPEQSRAEQSRVVQSRKISLLLILTCMQPRMWFLGCECTVMNILGFLWKAALTPLCPAFICTQECPALGGGSYTWPCSSRVLHMYTSQVFCPGL